MERGARARIQGSADFHDAHAHLEGQRPAGRIVRLLRRTLGVLAQIGIVLGLEQVAHELRELLIHGYDPRPLRVRESID